MNKGFLGLGVAATVVFIAIGLIFESLIPGAIIHFAAGWSFVKSVLVAAAAQLAVIVLILLAVTGFGLAAR